MNTMALKLWLKLLLVTEPEGSFRSTQKKKAVKKEHEHGGYQFQMPLHYPRYTKEDHEEMEEWKVDLVLKQYGLSFKSNLEEKKAFAKGTFLWPDLTNFES